MKIQELPIDAKVKDLLSSQGYGELYPPQEEAVKAGVLDGKNLVLASPTASGKTLVAELAIVKTILEGRGKAIYLTPLRALASEKFADLMKYSDISKPDGQKIRVAVSTGDYDSSDSWLAKYDVIVSTNEKADSILRHRTKWIEEIALVVADEVHLLSEAGRGPTLEVILTRLMQINPHVQVLALSATVRNSEEIGEWLNATPVTTNWRPVPLLEGVYCNGQIQFKDGSSRIVQEVAGNPVLDICLDVIRKGGQALVFTETRKTAVDAAKKAAEALKTIIPRRGERALSLLSQKVNASGEKTRLSQVLSEVIARGAAFHHAGLEATHRRIVEDGFRAGMIRILSATPTLAAGVNLPARTVVITSYERYEPGFGRSPISVLEYKQFCGRAGRPKYDDFGEAILLARTPDDQDFLFQNYVLAEPEKLWSKLAAETVLRPHVLSTIAAGYARSENGLYDFFSRTFYSHQYGAKAMKSRIGDILRFLYEETMLSVEGNTLSATTFGRRVSELYIDPVSAVIIRDALYNRAENLTELSFLHMICRTPDMAPKLYPRRSDADRLAALTEEHKDEFMFDPPEDSADPIQYEEFLAELKGAKVLFDWIEEVSEDSILEVHGVEPGDLLRLTDTSDWLLHASHELGKLFGHKDLLPKLSELRLRIQKGVKKELVPLVRLDGIGRIRARSLNNAGFKSLEHLKRASITELIKVPLIGPTVAKKIKEQVGGKISSEEWEMLKHVRSDETPEQRQLTEF